MSKKFLRKLQTIVMVAIMSVGFASCGDDDQKIITPVTDGLEGYWFNNTEKINYNNLFPAPYQEVQYGSFYRGRLFYLDGKGGGTYWGTCITEDPNSFRHSNSNYNYYIDFYNYNQYTTLVGKFKDGKGNTDSYYASEYTEARKGTALIYAKTGSTISITSVDAEAAFMVNATDGSIKDHIRLTKVE